MREFVLTAVILLPGVGNPGSVLPAVAHFRWISWIRRRIPGGPKSDDSTMILALFLGKWGPILRKTIEKPKENQGFWLQPLKNLRKINVFGPWGPMGPPGAPWGHNVAPWGLPGLPDGPHGAQWALAPWGPRAPRGYIDKLPINRPNGGVLVIPNQH